MYFEVSKFVSASDGIVIYVCMLFVGPGIEQYQPKFMFLQSVVSVSMLSTILAEKMWKGVEASILQSNNFFPIYVLTNLVFESHVQFLFCF